MIETDGDNDLHERAVVYSTKYSCIVIASIKTVLYITTEQLGVDTYPEKKNSEKNQKYQKNYKQNILSKKKTIRKKYRESNRVSNRDSNRDSKNI